MRKDWIPTYTGKTISVVDPDPADVCIEDIAHHLALINRYTGATFWPYSVAQHSILVSQHVPLEDALWGLLHDAAEAYVGDMNRPLKHSEGMGVYRRAEDRMLDAIATALNLPGTIPESVKQADNEALVTEVRDLLEPCDESWDAWTKGITPWPERIIAWDYADAEIMFLDAYYRILNRSKQCESKTAEA